MDHDWNTWSIRKDFGGNTYVVEHVREMPAGEYAFEYDCPFPLDWRDQLKALYDQFDDQCNQKKGELDDDEPIDICYNIGGQVDMKLHIFNDVSNSIEMSIGFHSYWGDHVTGDQTATISYNDSKYMNYQVNGTVENAQQTDGNSTLERMATYIKVNHADKPFRMGITYKFKHPFIELYDYNHLF